MINILLVEDTHFGVRYVKRALADWPRPHRITVASDGQKAFDALGLTGGVPNQPLPDVLLLDLKMPRVDGIEVLTRLRCNIHTRSMKAIVLTTSDSPFDMDHVSALAADDYLLKSCPPAVLQATLDRVLGCTPPTAAAS